MDQPVVDEDQRARRFARMRMTLMSAIATLALVAIVLSPSEEERGGTDPKPTPVVDPLTRALAAAGDGFLYPASLPERDVLVGEWSRTDGFRPDSVFPELGNNLTCEFRVQHGLPPPGEHGFFRSEGVTSMVLHTTPYYSLESLHTVLLGSLTLYDSDMEHADGAPKLRLNVTGNYYNDVGVLVLIGSSRPATAELVLASPSSTPSSLSPSPSAAAPTPGAGSSTSSGSSSASPSTSPSPAASSSGDFPARQLPSLQQVRATTSGSGGAQTASRVKSAMKLAAAGGEAAPQPNKECTYAIVLRARPLGYVAPSDAAPASSGTASRRLLSADASSSTVVPPLRTGGLLSAVGDALARRLLPGRSLLSGALGQDEDAWQFPDAVGAASAAGELQQLLRSMQQGMELEGPLSHDPALGAQQRGLRAGDAPAAAFAAAGAPRALAPETPSSVYQGAQYVSLYGRAVSWNCNVSFNLSIPMLHLNGEATQVKTSGYSLLATNAQVVLLGVLSFQLVRASSASAFSRVSLAFIGIQTVTDAMVCLVHSVFFVMRPQLFFSFWTVAACSLFLFAVLEMRFLLFVYKAHRPELFANGWAVLRRAVLGLYLRFYAATIGGIMLMVSFDMLGRQIVAVVALSYWVPQIIYSATRDARPPFTPSFVITTSLARLAIPLYFLACPSNWSAFLQPPESRADVSEWGAGRAGDLSNPPPAWRAAAWYIAPDAQPALLTPEGAAEHAANVRFAEALTLWTLLQMVVVLLQSRKGWGPRFFVPYAFLPPKYDYHRVVTLLDGRVAPDPAATAHWVRGVAVAAPAAAAPPPEPGAAAAAGGAPSAPAADANEEGAGDATGATAAAAPAPAAAGADPASAFSAAGASMMEEVAATARSAATDWRRWAVESAQGTYAGSVWFLGGCRILARDARMWVRHFFVKDGASQAGGGAGSPPGGAGASSEPRIASSAGATAPPSGQGGSGGGPTGGSGWDVAAAMLGRGGGAGGRYVRLDAATAPPGGLAVATARESTEEEGGASSGRGSDVSFGAAGVGGGLTAGGGAEVPPAPPAVGVAEDAAIVVGPAPSVTVDCVVCMGELTFPMSRWNYMVTPCDHLFHTTCLQPWLDQKLECPTCRMQLPEPEVNRRPGAATATGGTGSREGDEAAENTNGGRA